MRIRTNIMAMNTHRMYTNILANLSRSVERLSTGLRINRAADDPAGLAISEKMRAQIRGMKMAARNCQDAISMIQTAEGALHETHAIIQRMRELALQAASDTNEDLIDRNALNAEYQQLLAEINDISKGANYNTRNLLDGSASGGLVIQTGPNQGDELTIIFDAMNNDVLGLTGSSIGSRDNASQAIGFLDKALNQVSTQRSYLGAVHNRLEFKISNLLTSAENLSEAESRIRDLDYAAEMMEYTRNQILLQSAIAMMAQANAMPNIVLQLLNAL